MNDATSPSAAHPADQWWVLEHRPGPALEDGASLFAHPRFADHVAFLRRLDDAGLLVAAGSLPDEEGAGMTVVRTAGGVPDAAEIERLATEDDRCVAAGVLAVRVRRWQVVLSRRPGS
jgi:uncharacterized protein YciI